jgi:MoaA/NifB/PqqE/SkfB family radical SAM enzyme
MKENFDAALSHKKSGKDLALLVKKIPSLLQTYISPHLFSDTRQFFVLSAKKITKTFPIEVHVVEHCNLNCKWCSHFSSLAGEEYLDPVEFEKDCKRLSQLTKKLFAFKLLGGEPLLHPKIIDFFEITRKYFADTPIQITTNGILLLKMSESFWESCHKNNIKISISQYPIKLNKAAIKETAKKHKVKIEFSGTTEQYRMCKLPLDPSGKQNMKDSYKNCVTSWGCCVTMRDGKIYTCCTAAHIKFFNSYFNQNLAITEKDYIDIYKIERKQEIIDFLSKPFPFCRYCRAREIELGVEWAVSKKEISEWV